jgi:hypothetical protein
MLQAKSIALSRFYLYFKFSGFDRKILVFPSFHNGDTLCSLTSLAAFNYLLILCDYTAVESGPGGGQTALLLILSSRKTFLHSCPFPPYCPPPPPPPNLCVLV